MREKEEKIETFLFEKILYSKSFEKLVKKYGSSPARKSLIFKVFEKLGNFKFSDFKGYFIATSHIDAAWLWTAYDTKVRVWRTFDMAIKHIRKYPFYSISITSPQYYDWIKRYDKDMWELIKKYVAENKIDIFGGMWVEPDLNIPCGESLIRQRLYGQHYYLRNFGKISKVEAVLDVFGYTYSLPQILKKTGAEMFWTTKLTWNDYTLWPFANFIWRGVDGSEIQSHMFKFNTMALMDMGLYKITGRILKPERETGGNDKSNEKHKDKSNEKHKDKSNERGNGNAEKNLVFNSHNLKDCEYKTFLNVMGTRIGKIDTSTLEELNKYLSNEYLKTVGIFYGQGDGGKGPLTIEIEMMKKIMEFYGYKHTTAHNYFRILKKDLEEITNGNIPIWDDELYLEYHRGCLITNVNIKQKNRFAENMIISAENLSTISLLNPMLLSVMQKQNAPFNGFPYLKIWKAWRKILFNQFHDILPGSSIPEVYLLAWKELDEAYNDSKEIIENNIQMIWTLYKDAIEQRLFSDSSSINKGSLDDNSNILLIYNPVGVENSAYIRFKKSNDNSNDNSNHAENLVKLDGIPPFSIIALNRNLAFEKLEYLPVSIVEKDAFILIENSKIKVHISKKNGNIKGIWQKGDNKGINILYAESDYADGENIEKLKGIRLKVYKENFKKNPYPAWNISHNFTQDPVEVKLESVSICSDASLLQYGAPAVVEAKFSFKNSKANLKYILYPNDSMLQIKIDIDLKDRCMLVKYFMPCNIKSNKVASEIQFGAIERSRIPQTKMEKAKWEMSMHKWIDLSDEDHGIAILNKSRYSFSPYKNGVAISLVRSPPYASSPFYSHLKIFKNKKDKPKYTDLMLHHFHIAIYPHKNKWNQADIVQKSLAFNNPPLIFEADNLKALNNDEISSSASEFSEELSQKELFEQIDLKGFMQNSHMNKIQAIKIPTFSFKTSDPFVIITTLKPSEWMIKTKNNNSNSKSATAIENKPENGCNGYTFKDNNRDTDLFLPEDYSSWKWDNKSFILRAYEAGGATRNIIITISNIPKNIKIKAIEEVDMLEMNKIKQLEFRELKSEGNSQTNIEIPLKFGKFEIKTLKILFENIIGDIDK
ncbi:MAG: alpha-mannosidase [Promethearchaeota archaeon]